MSKVYESVRNTLEIESKSILDALASIDPQAVEHAVEVIASCKGKVAVAGRGTSGAAGKKIAHTLNCVNRPALFLTPSDAVHGGMGVLDENDVLILLSKGGMTEEINKLIGPAKTKGAFVIGVCEKEESQLAKECDLYLKIKVEREADQFGLLATSSILGVISVFDAIAVAVMEKNKFTREQFGVIHPGGAVGEKLLRNKTV